MKTIIILGFFSLYLEKNWKKILLPKKNSTDRIKFEKIYIIHSYRIKTRLKSADGLFCITQIFVNSCRCSLHNSQKKNRWITFLGNISYHNISSVSEEHCFATILGLIDFYRRFIELYSLSFIHISQTIHTFVCFSLFFTSFFFV